MVAATAGSAGAFTVTMTASCGPRSAGLSLAGSFTLIDGVGRFHRQAVGADRGEVCAARDHRNVGAARGQKPAR